MQIASAEPSEATSALPGNESAEAFMDQRGPLAYPRHTLSLFNQGFVEIDRRAHGLMRQ